MQIKAVLWITGAFHTLPTMGVEAIADLALINLYLKKLYQKFHLQWFSLPPNHIIKLILMSINSNKHNPYKLSLESLTTKQKLKLQSSLINMDNSCNKYILLFSSFNQEFSFGNRLINSFSDQFSFHYHSWEAKNQIKNLDDTITEAFSDPFSSIVVSDTSIKNSITTSMLYIHSYNKPIIKTIHWAINIIATKTELFVIRYGINQAVNCQVQFTLGWKSTKWTQRCADLWNNLSFSLYAVPSVCHMVTTSDNREKSEMRVSTDWCIAIEH